MGRKAAVLVAAFTVLPYVSAFHPSSAKLARLRESRAQVSKHANAGTAVLRSGPSLRNRKHQQKGPCMMTVIDALSSPLVLTAGAVGTVSGLGRVAANVPQFLGRLYGFAQEFLPEGVVSVSNTEAVPDIRQELERSKELRAAFLKVCIGSDTTGDGNVHLEELNAYFQKHGRNGMIQMGGDLLRPRMVSVLTMGEVMGMETEEEFDYVSYFKGLAGSEEGYNTLHEDASKMLVDDAYEGCRVLTAEYAKTFYLATRAMPTQQARATWAIYAWCRRVDELVDGPDVNPDPEVQKAGLGDWMTRLERMWNGDRYALAGLDEYDMAFSDMIKSFPGADIEPYRDMVRGMLMDVSDKVTYESWDELYLYCYRVASTVGLMTMPVMGTATGVTMEEARDPAVALGIALQITNILRDVGEDARDRGRIYLPEEDLRRFGVASEYILDRSAAGAQAEIDNNYRELVKFEIARARQYYTQAEEGIPLLAPSAQLPVAVAMELYREILNKIELNNYDNLSKRAYLTAGEKMRMVPGIWIKTQTGQWGGK